MAVSYTFLNTCRAAIALLPELTAFQTAYTAYGAASNATRSALWIACFGDAQPGLSPAYRLRRAIRNTVYGQSDASSYSQSDLEAAYQTLRSEYAIKPPPPQSYLDEIAEVRAAVIEDMAT